MMRIDSRNFSIEQVSELPSLADVAQMLPDLSNEIRGPVNVVALVMEYQESLRVAVETIRSGGTFPPSFSLFVPDFWHISKGRVASLPKEEGDRLWEASVLGLCLGRTYMRNTAPAGQESQEVYGVAFRHNYPGRYFYPRA